MAVGLILNIFGLISRNMRLMPDWAELFRRGFWWGWTCLFINHLFRWKTWILSFLRLPSVSQNEPKRLEPEVGVNHSIEPHNRKPENKEEDEDFTGDEYRVDKADEFYCVYDSTWETEDNESPSERKTTHSRGYRNYKFSRFENAARDMWNYRHDYPKKLRTQNFTEHEQDAKLNLNFYLGNTPSLPDGLYIHNFHCDWHRDYDNLEHVHTYIQWLFPLQEPGVNYQAKTLTKEEIQDFLNNERAKQNLLKSYKLMLDFYGIELKDEGTGELKRAHNWRERFQNLNSHTHNNLRITRILKCLGTLGYSHYQAPLVQFFLRETLVNGELHNVKDSALSYFVFAVLNKQERRKLLWFAFQHYEPKGEFVWCPKKVQEVWLGRMRDETETQENTSLPHTLY